MDKKELIERITLKKEFSKLPEKDVELAFEKFDKPRNADYQKLKLTRQFLRKVYSSFASRKLLGIKDRDVSWVLNKHKSTKERLPYYEEVYGRIFKNMNEKTISVIDLGAGVNGFSYGFFINKKINYIGVEAVGQLVDLMNYFFKGQKTMLLTNSSTPEWRLCRRNKKRGQIKEKINGKAFHLSLFETEKIKELIKKQSKPRIIFLFKVIDSLEIIERDYSKKLLDEIVPLADKVVLSFATKSLGRRSRFGVQRLWIKKFIEENFEVLDNFEIGGEQYLIFQKSENL